MQTQGHVELQSVHAKANRMAQFTIAIWTYRRAKGVKKARCRVKLIGNLFKQRRQKLVEVMLAAH